MGLETAPAVTAENDTAGGMDSSASLVEIANDLTGTMPDVQQHAIDQAAVEVNASSVPAAAPPQNTRASSVPGFDPAVHAVNADGTPKLRADGSFALKRGRKAGGAVQSKIAKPTAGTQSAGPSSAEISARASGVVAARTLMTFGVMLGGDEWQPRKDDSVGLDEAKQMEAAFSDYFIACGYTDIPPGWGLAIVMGAYAMPRFFMPKTKTRVTKIKDWCVAKYVQWKARRAGIKVQVEPRKD